MLNAFKQKIEQVRYQLFESNHTIINWDDFDKGVLLLIFGMLSQVNSFAWYYPHVHDVDTMMWFDQSYFDWRITVLVIGFFFFTLMLGLSLYYKHVQSFRTFISYLAPLSFALTMIHSGYTIGIYSPATMAGTVNLILVGFVFYRREMIYITLIPVLLSITLVCWFTSTNKIDYAPVFSDALNNGVLYLNKFWIASMAQLYLPILLVSMLFVEILLSQWRRREKNIEYMSQTDALTNVFNRRYISSQLSQLENIQTGRYAVVLLDLDHFKLINDHHGHEVGDSVLQRVAQVLIGMVRSTDIVGRFGGEEFILILKNQDLERAIEVAERCRMAIEAEKIVLDDGEVIQITASFGVALSQPNLTKEMVTRLADQALYQAKAAGRNLVCSAA